jgi:23S rRNA (adenine2503-C2)-methyltransferase
MNLIRFHSIPDAPFKGSSEIAIERFKSLLEKEGLITTIRASRGEDISAACGLLSTREINKVKK